MTGIQLNGQFLQLAANTVATIKRGNPFLDAEAINGEYSLPITVVYTESNYQALQGYFSFLTKKQKLRVPAAIFDGTAFSFNGTLVVESLESNLNNHQSGRLTGYFLAGFSSFFSNSKGKLLKDLDFGGIRRFDFTSTNPYDASGGFWQHVHSTWTDNSIPYVFYPIRNEAYRGEGGNIDFINKIDDGVNPVQLSFTDNTYSLCPHIRLVWMLQTMFANFGFTITGTVINDPDFMQLTIPSFYAIAYRSEFLGTYVDVSFDLKEHLPPEWTVTDVMINLWQLMGVTFIFDSAKREVNLKALRDVRNGVRKDWTAYCDASFKDNFNTDEHIYALKNSIDSGDSLPGSAIDFDKVNVLPPAYSFNTIPSPDASNLDKFIFVYVHNSWYQCVYESPYYLWIPAAYNIFGYEPVKFTDSFETKISTMPVITTQVDYDGGIWFRLYPVCKQEGNWAAKITEYRPWGMRLLFYRGMATDVTAFFLTDPGSRQYPFATNATHSLAHNTDPHGNWALSYIYSFNGTDVGIYSTWWKAWLQLLEREEIMTVRLHLPRHVLLDHKADDIILIRNVPFVVENMDINMPYPGWVDGELRRMG